MKIRPFLAVLPVVLVLGGCAVDGTPIAAARQVTVTVTAPGDAPPPESSAPAGSIPAKTPLPDACSLLTQEEANTLAGRTLLDMEPAGVEFGAATMCQFAGNPEDPGIAQVTVFVGDGVEKSLQIDRDTLKHTFTQPAGIGDEAWQEDGNIFVRKGTVWVQISLVLLTDDAENVVPLQEAAKLALSRF
ncbi:DUF3558 domain-containing protein [Nakamurella sp. YIM 132087]|uniref:DUF3558 domain-containing protein n=1 Tax=Nakamurella alba TaxID=2665158 RepID=A0A7K1FF74_9ACTN|nr:DUF3558 domain-containing protein [Nakamurella alba]MTD12730.1 DUF3558 domain-containing protein [Nakamurella alba]